MRGWAFLGAALALAACDVLIPVDPQERPQGRPDRPDVAAAPAPRSAVSLELEQYYARVEQSLLSQGLLRTGGGGPDTPFDDRVLAQNFIQIALFEEYSDLGGRLVQQESESRLHRWERPVRMNIEIGAAVSPDKATQDRRAITRYASRLAGLSGLDIRVVPQDGNFTIFILTEDERRELGPRLRELVPGISNAAVRTVTDLPRTSYCLVFALDADETGKYSKAVAVIRAEHPDLLRLSCIHEEIAQGLGLSNDSPAARPSIFNDDEEFALLTTHDEFLLRMLYDPRLRPGMSADQARPIARRIATELLGGGPS